MTNEMLQKLHKWVHKGRDGGPANMLPKTVEALLSLEDEEVDDMMEVLLGIVGDDSLPTVQAFVGCLALQGVVTAILSLPEKLET